MLLLARTALVNFMTDILGTSLDGAQILLYTGRISTPLLVADLTQPTYTGYAALTPPFIGPRVFPTGEVGATAVADFEGTSADPQAVQGYAVAEPAGIVLLGWEDFPTARLVGDVLHPLEILVNIWLDPDANFGKVVVG